MTPDASQVPGAVAVILVAVATLAIGTWGVRFSRTTSDFFVASRTVRPRLNASAIGGEYLSAASFLGVAGLILTFGAEMLWYPVGWTAGYLVLMVLVAAPLRRSGAYTLPDFAEARLASKTVRRLAGAFVVGVGWLYLLPQLQGAGLTLSVLTDAPEWLGATERIRAAQRIRTVERARATERLCAAQWPELGPPRAHRGHGSPPRDRRARRGYRASRGARAPAAAQGRPRPGLPVRARDGA